MTDFWRVLIFREVASLARDRCAIGSRLQQSTQKTFNSFHSFAFIHVNILNARGERESHSEEIKSQYSSIMHTYVRGIKKARRNVVTEIVIRRLFAMYRRNIYGAREFVKTTRSKKLFCKR